MSAHQEPDQRLACWVISLHPDAERTSNLLSSLRAQQVTADVFQAVDGRKGYPALQPGERLCEHRAMVRNAKTLTATELGCYLSHLRAVRQAYEGGYEYVCLIEDDVVIEDNFAEVIAALMAEQLELVRLMALKIRRRKVVKNLSGGVQLCRPERGTLGTQAYLMNRQGMRKFLGHASLIYEAIDHVLDHFFLFNLDTYLVEPHIAYEQAAASSVSKKPDSSARAPLWWESLLHHPAKFYYSALRHAYFWRKRSELYPNAWPDAWPGKSPRLRGKGKQVEQLAGQRVQA